VTSAGPTVEELDAGLPALEDYLVAELPGCKITRYQHYLLVAIAGANSAVRTREQAERAVVALRDHAANTARRRYIALFDALTEVNATDSRQSIQLHGDVAGAALRDWAASRGFEVKAEILPSKDLGVQWKTLRVQSPTHPSAISDFLVVHLDELTPLAAGPAEGSS